LRPAKIVAYQRFVFSEEEFYFVLLDRNWRREFKLRLSMAFIFKPEGQRTLVFKAEA
jgi:hypothetical protein